MSEEKIKCPKCGSEINENQKICSHCGAKFDNVETENKNTEIYENESVNEVQNETAAYDRTSELVQPEETQSNNLHKKIIAVIGIIMLIFLSAFGIVQYKQYKKDIAPMEIVVNFVKGNDVVCTLTYDKHGKYAKLSMLHKGIIIEQWQLDALKDFGNEYTLEQKNNKLTKIHYKFYFSDSKRIVGEPLNLTFKVVNVNSPKEFAEFKKDFNNLTLSRTMPPILNENIKTRLDAKDTWLKWKKEKEAREAAQRKQKEWQQHVLSNCVYKTSNGVCFTTQVNETEFIYDGDDFQQKNYWLGAKDYCESKGYKLPNDDDLRSLFEDVLGIEINTGINIETNKYSSDTVPTNYNILKRIAPNGFSSYGTGTSKWNYVDLWEDKEFDSKTAYARIKDVSWGTDETYQHTKEKYSYNSGAVICVYDPNGSPKQSIRQERIKQKELYEKKQEEERQKQKMQVQTERKREVENDLF